ncbi:hypothetical protein DV701_04240 [Ornithinimicrobium avium]|uniref:Muconolactone isomerase domain-containing protein n=2 Tax=Ornithinimicrobium avium TaxID=2283195 RepID=A0A345NK83_9MICO|nr:hypothetical protein DV701_04240 [Ornithinimicrobium avium]
MMRAEHQSDPTCSCHAPTLMSTVGISGHFANYCLFDVESHEEMHECVSGLPMFGFISTQVEALSRHPNAIGR